MASQLESLWNEFAAETEEHLDALERLLADHSSEWSAAEIGALFRYFHSLKGTFLAMGFTNVEAVAHHCEDILSLVRDGRTPLQPALVKVLLRAVDRLKDMREDVIATQKDAAPAADILRELAKHSQHQEQEKPEGAPAVVSEIPLNDDAEMLAIYSELLDQRLPGTALALSSVAEDRAAAAETANELAYGAEMMSFDALAEQLNALAALAKEDSPERGELIQRFCELREQSKIIEEVTGAKSGAELLTAALTVQLGQDYATAFDALSVAVAQFDESKDDVDQVLMAATSLRAIAVCQGFEQTARLLVVFEERIRSLDLLDSSQRAPIFDLARNTVELLRPHVYTGADIETNRADALAARWQATFEASDSSALTETAARIELSREVLATLSPEQRAKLEAALNEGQRAFEVLLDLEANPEIAGDIIAWLSSSVETITSRTAYRGGANCFEFLVFTEHPTAWIHAQLAALDPDQACLRGINELGGTMAEAPTGAAAPTAPTRTPLIRVPSEIIDDLMAEIGEMRTALASLADTLQHGRIAKMMLEARRLGDSASREEADLRGYLSAIETDMRELRALQNTLEGAHRRIWTVGLQLRVIPVDGLLSRLSRAARDLAQRLGKDVDVAVEGREVRIDKSMVDLLVDPLMHMVRNAIDHGIEAPPERRAAGKPAQPRLSISAAEQGNRVDIRIADNGRGLERAKIAAKAVSLGIISQADVEQMIDKEITALIFRPGFSTADSVTEISGRGVGLDVVAAAVQRLGGAVDVESSFGSGTIFTLKLPISAALLPTLLVEVAGQIFALPERQIVSVLECAKEDIHKVAGQQMIIHRGASVPVHELAAVLGYEVKDTGSDVAHLAIVLVESRMFALNVDRVLRFQDLFLKELHPMLAAIPLIAGASVLGDGSPVLVLDPSALVRPAVSEEKPISPTTAH